MQSSQLLHSFFSVNKNIVRIVQNIAVENDLTVPQYTILMIVIHSKEMTQKKVGEQSFLPKSTLSQAVDGLVRLGLLERQQVVGNRREMNLIISEKGERYFKDIHLQNGGIHELFQAAIKPLSNMQREELLNMHLQIAKNLEAYQTTQGDEMK
ncbi:MarR family transcriptional regulator [Oceanobacillus arenosus]|uniref:MarR family transcriptional regulator n=2 Tax=Oceanobacillus arenosus TaxID=1229153 RepID=A0A3D8PQY6_9BACI|nr:MarR family transcriptional regulator [Oceanobacillus arenosus]